MIYIDHSLKRADGHHHDYAVHTMHAARLGGLAPILVTHRKLRRLPAGRLDVPHFPLFHCGTYNPYTLASAPRGWPFQSSAADVSPSFRATWQARLRHAFEALRHRMWRIGRSRHVRQFASDCRRLWKAVGSAPGDIVFLPTMSELDLLGLAHFLAGLTPKDDLSWHVQFHYGIIEGRELEVPEERDRWTAFRAAFHDACQRMQGHRVSFYCTTPELAAEYDRLEVAKFQPLAYPVNPAFVFGASGGNRPAGPFRIVCPGGPRKEKGTNEIEHVARALHRELLEGRALLCVQSRGANRGGASRQPAIGPFWRDRSTKDGDVGWQRLPHPLSPEAYIELIQTADLGLLLYDSDRYAKRRAGVLGEFLAAGVPVIVPAASWLAEQIAEPTYEYLERFLHQGNGAIPTEERPFEERQAWSLPSTAGACDAIVSLRRGPAEGVATYGRLTITQRGADGSVHAVDRSIHGLRRKSDWIHVLVPVHARTATIVFDFQSEHCDMPPRAHIVRMALLPSDARWPQGRPRAVVGRILAAFDEAADAVREIMTHARHYRETAHAFSRPWSAAHDPNETIRQICQDAVVSDQAARATRPDSGSGCGWAYSISHSRACFR